jgi:hypothetical protein
LKISKRDISMLLKMNKFYPKRTGNFVNRTGTVHQIEGIVCRKKLFSGENKKRMRDDHNGSYNCTLSICILY